MSKNKKNSVVVSVVVELVVRNSPRYCYRWLIAGTFRIEILPYRIPFVFIAQKPRSIHSLEELDGFSFFM